MIRKEEIAEATLTLKKYRDGLSLIRNRVIENEEWYKMRHWKEIRKRGNEEDPLPVSGWLLNVLMNKHADAMDNYPEPVFLPREESDEATARQLSQIVPVILERNEFAAAYAENWWYKLKNGTAVYGVFWDRTLQNGLGDIVVSRVDLLNIYWQPGITDIQDSRNVFTVELMDNDVAEMLYGKINPTSASEVARYFTDETVDTASKCVVVDWYYKKLNKDGTYILHYCKFIGDKIIYSSENEDKDTPYYAHNMYPFVFDNLFPEEGTIVGFGYIDTTKDSQMYIDQMQQVILKNTIAGARRRFFVSNSCNVNVDDFSDSKNEIIGVAGSVDDTKIREITTRPLDDIYVTVMNNKIQEMKETAGNRDFQQGGVANGVTAASAIAALQESGSKLSRDMIRSSYWANNRINYLIVELIRQFYDAPRKFRITNEEGENEYISVDNTGLKPQVETEFGQETDRLPIFDIDIRSQKSNPFSQASMNEEAKTLFQMGFFNPQLADQAIVALNMMQFEGIDKVKAKVGENLQLMQQVQQMQQQMQQMAQIIQQLQGTDLRGSVQAAGNEVMDQRRPNQVADMEESVNQLGRAYRFAKRDRTEAARAQALDTTSVENNHR